MFVPDDSKVDESKVEDKPNEMADTEQEPVTTGDDTQAEEADNKETAESARSEPETPSETPVDANQNQEEQEEPVPQALPEDLPQEAKDDSTEEKQEEAEPLEDGK